MAELDRDSVLCVDPFVCTLLRVQLAPIVSDANAVHGPAERNNRMRMRTLPRRIIDSFYPIPRDSAKIPAVIIALSPELVVGYGTTQALIIHP